MKRWIRACASADVEDGEMREVSIADPKLTLLVARTDGEVFASAAICPHEDVHLCTGSLLGGRVICPGHGYRFSLRDGRCEPNRRLRLTTYRTEERAGDIWIELFGYRG